MQIEFSFVRNERYAYKNKETRRRFLSNYQSTVTSWRRLETRCRSGPLNANWSDKRKGEGNVVISIMITIPRVPNASPSTYGNWIGYRKSFSGEWNSRMLESSCTHRTRSERLAGCSSGCPRWRQRIPGKGRRRSCNRDSRGWSQGEGTRLSGPRPHPSRRSCGSAEGGGSARGRVASPCWKIFSPVPSNTFSSSSSSPTSSFRQRDPRTWILLKRQEFVGKGFEILFIHPSLFSISLPK